jgi:hypothetical protein
MFVGDVILSAREAVPDLPGVLPPPNTSNIGGEVTIQGWNPTPGFPPGTYYVVATYSTLWGETVPGQEISVQSTSPLGLNVTVTQPYGTLVTAINIYMGNTSGGEAWQFILTGPFAAGQVFQITGATQLNPVTPPLGNSAFLPDSGGSVASASQVYRWLTDALNHLSALNGGVPDMSGFQTQVGKANYTVPGDWQTLSDAWYDGYPLLLGSSSLVFRRNTISALSGSMSYTQVADTLVIELFAQPNRTPGYGILSSPMGISDTALLTSGLQGWLLPFGLAQIGAGGAFPSEIVAYTTSGNNLISLVRGLGGTNAQAWPAGTTPVYELNCMFKGLRAPQLYQPGMAMNTLRLPSSWVPLMHKYLLSRYRQIEQQQDESDKLLQQFQAGAKEATKKKPAVGDRQIQPQENVGVEVYPLLSKEFGGALIP